MMFAAALLLIQPQTNGATATAMQGKGGTIKPVPTPTPAPRKVTPKKTAPTSTRVNTRPNQSAKSKEDEAAATERTYWETIRNSTDPEDFRAYLKKYPAGQFADLANNRIRALEAAAKPQPSPTPSPTPAPAPEPAYEWTKSERDLLASVRLEWREGYNLSFSVPSGWTRTERKEGTHYLQINFRSPDSPQTNISIQIYSHGISHYLRDGYSEIVLNEERLVDSRRNLYASQTISAKLTDTEGVTHTTGRWHTFTADLLDVRALERLVPTLDAVYPDDVWGEKDYSRSFRDYSFYKLKTGSLHAFNRTRHSYAIREADYGYGNACYLVLLYTAPIEQFDEKLLPSVMATLKMPGTIKVQPASSDSSVSLSKYEPEIMIDGERKGEDYKRVPISAGKHHVTVRAKEHKPFEKDVFIAGWEDLNLEVKLERTVSGTGGAKPK
jgi:hypothetical protein